MLLCIAAHAAVSKSFRGKHSSSMRILSQYYINWPIPIQYLLTTLLFCRISLRTMTSIGDWYDGQVGTACGLAFGCGFICFLIGILKERYKLDKQERRFVMWVAGVIKMATSAAITYSPDSAGHKLCSACCAIGLVLLIAGAVADNLAWLCWAKKVRCRSRGYGMGSSNFYRFKYIESHHIHH